jgi:hypothetical protein
VIVLAPVLKLDQQAAGLYGRARERQPELVTTDEKTGRSSGNGGKGDRDGACENAANDTGHPPNSEEGHFSSDGRPKRAASGITAAASVPSHCSSSAL